MADVKISQLPQAALPLAGTEVFPLVQNGVTVQAPVNNVGSVANIAALRSITPVAGLANNVDGYYTAGDGGGGQFYAVTGAPAGTYVENGGTVILPTNGDGSSAWLRNIDGEVYVAFFGAKGDGVTDDTAAIQAALDYGYANTRAIYIPGGGYVISQLYVKARLIGDASIRFRGTLPEVTLISNVDAGLYALTLGQDLRPATSAPGPAGALENITLQVTGAGNGIHARGVSAKIAMQNVSVISSYTLVTGSGSIGVMFGTDDLAGVQAITCVFDSVTVRNFDTDFYMGYYSNNNIYRKLYALQTSTDAPTTRATNGFYIRGRGGVYDGCGVENFFLNLINEVGGANGAEENLFLNFWAEGLEGVSAITFNGSGTTLINPYGFVGTTRYPVTLGPYVTITKKRGASVTAADFVAGTSANMIRNAEFTYGLSGLNWGTAVASATPIYGYNSLSIQAPTSVTSITIDYTLNDFDLTAQTWLIGRNVTFFALGQAEAGVNMSVRCCVRNAAGNVLQLATCESFTVGSPSMAKATIQIPATVSGQPTTRLVFRVAASNVTGGTPSIAGRIAMPMVFLGNDLQAISGRLPTDGTNTLYGLQTIAGGAWDTGHLVLGIYHLWVDASGRLRIKNAAPTSDTDGVVVGTQV